MANNLVTTAGVWYDLSLEELVKCGAILSGFIYLCGFLNQWAFLRSLGINPSEIAARNTDLFYNGTYVVTFCFLPTATGFIGSHLGHKLVRSLWPNLIATMLLTVLVGAYIGWKIGVRGSDLLIFCVFELALAFFVQIAVDYSSVRPRVQLVTSDQRPIGLHLELSQIVAFIALSAIGMSFVAGVAQGKEMSLNQRQIQMQVDPSAIQGLLQAGLIFDNGKAFSNPVPLIYASDTSYFVRPNERQVVEIARNKVLVTVRSASPSF